MTYNYRGKAITLDDKLVERYKEVWFRQEPDDSLFDRYLSAVFGRISDAEIEALDDATITAAITRLMRKEIYYNT